VKSLWRTLCKIKNTTLNRGVLTDCSKFEQLNKGKQIQIDSIFKIKYILLVLALNGKIKGFQQDN
jgi:hypothetical protein